MSLLALILGCPSGAEDSSTTSDCASLDPTACAGRTDCRVIEGREVAWPDTGATCYDLGNEDPLGCMDAEGECTEAETFAEEPGGSCHWFHNGCTPAGWGACATDPTGVPECG